MNVLFCEDVARKGAELAEEYNIINNPLRKLFYLFSQRWKKKAE